MAALIPLFLLTYVVISTALLYFFRDGTNVSAKTGIIRSAFWPLFLVVGVLWHLPKLLVSELYLFIKNG